MTRQCDMESDMDGSCRGYAQMPLRLTGPYLEARYTMRHSGQPGA